MFKNIEKNNCIDARVGQRTLKQVGFDELEIRLHKCPCKESTLTRGKIVNTHHLMAVSQQAIDQIATDETGAPGDYMCTTHECSSLEQ
jgi:hypothetical protein